MMLHRVRCGTATSRWITRISVMLSFLLPLRSAAFCRVTPPTSAQRKLMLPLEFSFRKIKMHTLCRKHRCKVLKMSFAQDTNDVNDGTTTRSVAIDEYTYLIKVRECIEELSIVDDIDYINEWKSAVQMISALINHDRSNEISVEQIESSLAVAWNWKRYVIITSPIARKFIKTIQPNSTMINSSIQWLQHEGELLLPNETILQGILESPEAYLIEPQVWYEKALQSAPHPFHKNDAKFRELLLEHPSALQYTYNCIDTGCKSECGNCWVSLEFKMSERKR